MNGKVIEAQPLSGMFIASFKEFPTYFESRPINFYQQRVEDIKNNT